MSYGHCETTFVEHDGQDIFQRGAEARERAKALNKERQRELAEELSLITSEDYYDDVLDQMEHMQVCFRCYQLGVPCVHTANIITRPKHYRMLAPLIYKQRSNGT